MISHIILYLLEGALSLDEPDNGHQWNAYYGGKCHDPAKSLGPFWVVICVIVGQRLVSHQTENEYALHKTK